MLLNSSDLRTGQFCLATPRLQHMFQFPGEIKMSLCLHDTKRPVNSIKNNSQFGVGRTQLVRLGVCHHGRKKITKNNNKKLNKTKKTGQPYFLPLYLSCQLYRQCEMNVRNSDLITFQIRTWDMNPGQWQTGKVALHTATPF